MHRLHAIDTVLTIKWKEIRQCDRVGPTAKTFVRTRNNNNEEREQIRAGNCFYAFRWIDFQL